MHVSYTWKVKNKKEEFGLAQREHIENTIKNFNRKLNNFEVGVKIRKSYNFLRGYMKMGTRKMPIFLQGCGMKL